MPTGSKRTRCLSPMTPQVGRSSNACLGNEEGPNGVEPSSPFRLVPRASCLGGCRTATRSLADVVGGEGGPLVVAHLVEDDVRAQERRAATQVVQRPHLLRVEVEMRLRDQGLAVVAHVAH